MTRPNILHIFVDQQRFDTIGALNNPVIRTPNLDRLVRMGTAFTNAYTPSPVCIAARCATIHGQYPAHTSCYENTPMPTDNRRSFMDALAAGGYRTHGIGKCHFSPDPFALRGFLSREIQEEGLGKPLDKLPYLAHLQAKGYRHLLEPNGIRGEMYYIPQPSQLPPEDHPSQWIGDRSVHFINEQANRPDRWYLFASFIHPHPPFAPPNPWHKLYRPDQMPLPNRPDAFESLQTLVNRCQNRYKYRDNGFDLNLVRAIKAYYYACISFVDFQVGRLLDALEQTGQIDQTLIVFTADHGEHLGDYQCFGKRSMHDSCARIPLIVAQPGRFAAGQVCDEPVSLIDIAPTFLAASGTAIRSHALDGLDLHQVAAGWTDRPYVFGQLAFNAEPFLEPDPDFRRLVADPQAARAVFSLYMAAGKDWKYTYSAADSREMLFDKRRDSHETHDVAENPFCRRQRDTIKSALIDHLIACGETGGIENGDFRPFAVPLLKKNPDAGHLVQDYYTPWAPASIPGYSD